MLCRDIFSGKNALKEKSSQINSFPFERRKSLIRKNLNRVHEKKKKKSWKIYSFYVKTENVIFKGSRLDKRLLLPQIFFFFFFENGFKLKSLQTNSIERQKPPNGDFSFFYVKAENVIFGPNFHKFVSLPKSTSKIK